MYSEVKVTQSCPILCNSKDWNSPVLCRIPEWVAVPFSRGSSRPMNQTRVSCIAGRFFTSWATREAQIDVYIDIYIHIDDTQLMKLMQFLMVVLSAWWNSDGKCAIFEVNCNEHMKVKMKSLSCVRLFATPWTVARQAPPSMGFSRQEYWSGVPLPSPVDLPNPGIEPRSPTLQADALTYELAGKQWTYPPPKRIFFSFKKRMAFSKKKTKQKLTLTFFQLLTPTLYY